MIVKMMINAGNSTGTETWLITKGDRFDSDTRYQTKWVGMFQGGENALQAICGGFDSLPIHYMGVAQPGSASALGVEGRRFESFRSYRKKIFK